MKKLLLAVLLIATPAVAQVNYAQLRLKLTDPTGAAVQAPIELISTGNGYNKTFTTTQSGTISIHQLPYGAYQIRIHSPGFAPITKSIELRSALPISETITLTVAPVATTVSVTTPDTLIDPSSPSSVMHIGSKEIDQRVASLPGRSVQDLVNTQPGWLYEGNAVLHPRGSEYQTQFVLDGIPLTDNRSPSFGPEIEADDLESISIYTAGFPAEYGRKMGGVVQLDTKRNLNPGLHADLTLSGGSYATTDGFAQVQNTWTKQTLTATASGSGTAHYLNPVVPQNYTNRGTTADFSLKYDTDPTDKDRLILTVRHELSRYQVPNEIVQEQAGQLQTGDNFETLGAATYQHTLSPDTLATAIAMFRNNANDLNSNDASTPILATQHNFFNEAYFKATLSHQWKNHELKAGLESDNTFLHENFAYTLTDPTQFDDGTPPTLAFLQHRPDLEQSAFLEDLIRLGPWTISAGLRWDHYQLILNQNAASPRLSIGRYIPRLNLVLHASYDRIFQTPSNENILISSSPQITSLDPSVLRLPVKPSTGTYYEGGLTEGFRGRLRLDANLFRRDIRNYADDDQLLNTGVSYPIAFDKAILYGAEAKLSLVHLGPLTGFASYSYIVGNAWFPVTGGLFLGDDVTNALTQLSGHFPDSQDQRNTLRTRVQYQLTHRLWLASGANYGSGLPFDFDGTYQDALAEYSQSVVDRLNFNRGRILPTLAVNASFGAGLYQSNKLHTTFQLDTDNLNNRLNVIDFGGLFSGNAIAPGRSYTLRLNSTF
jgi:hypothetical protein